MRGVKFDLIDIPNSDLSETKRKKIIDEGKDKFGFLAQELQEVYPEVVDYDSTNDQYSIRYLEMIPILLEAIKEQQSIIENLQSDIASFKDSNLKNLSTIGEDKQIADQIILYQNSPNPFSENTEIRYFLSEKTKDAHINIYDMKGKQIKSITLSTWGESQVSIAAGEFDAGMYLYSLLADGQLIDTKQMVITD